MTPSLQMCILARLSLGVQEVGKDRRTSGASWPILLDERLGAESGNQYSALRFVINYILSNLVRAVDLCGCRAPGEN